MALWAEVTRQVWSVWEDLIVLAAVLGPSTDIHPSTTRENPLNPVEIGSGEAARSGSTSFLTDGVVYMWNRWQDPETGRFISEDPAQWGDNYYAYAGNNPELYIDSTGLKEAIGANDPTGDTKEEKKEYKEQKSSGGGGGKDSGGSTENPSYPKSAGYTYKNGYITSPSGNTVGRYNVPDPEPKKPGQKPPTNNPGDQDSNLAFVGPAVTSSSNPVVAAVNLTVFAAVVVKNALEEADQSVKEQVKKDVQALRDLDKDRYQYLFRGLTPEDVREYDNGGPILSNLARRIGGPATSKKLQSQDEKELLRTHSISTVDSPYVSATPNLDFAISWARKHGTNKVAIIRTQRAIMNWENEFGEPEYVLPGAVYRFEILKVEGLR